MLELSKIKFGVDTTELEAVTTKIATVIKAVEGLSNAQTRAQVNNSKASKAAAVTAQAEAKALLAQLKLQEAKEKQTKSSADTTERASRKASSALELETSKLEFMTQAYSQGMAGKLAYAKAAGATADELERLGKVLQDQRKIIGGDPFDKSLGGLKALGNEYSVVKEQMRLYNAELGLTQKQTQGLARDKLRMIEAAKIENKSIFGVREQIRLLNSEYIKVASAENALTDSFKKNQKATLDAAKATEFLQQEMNKVVFANQELNNSLGRGSSNQLLKFEQALKKTGKTAAEQKIELEKYRLELDKLEKKSGNAKADHISRAIAPQITDIVVGLSTGQSPLTVMLQQGGQLRDQLSMAGIAAADMGMAMRNAMSGMVTSVAAVGKAMGTMLIGGFLDAGAAVKNLAANMLGLNGVANSAKTYFEGLGVAGQKYISILNAVTVATNLAFGVGLVAGIAAIVAMGVAIVGVVKDNDKLAVSLGLTGAAMGLTFDSASDLAKGMQGVGVSTTDAMKVLVEMAKQGKFTADDVRLVTKAAVDLQTYGGVAIEDTVKQFAKMKEKPVEAMLELSKATGLVAVETVKAVMELEDQGKTADATALAIKALADVNDQQVQRMKESYNGFSLFMIDLGKGISKFFSDAFKDMFYASSPKEQLKKQLKAVDETLANWGTMKMDAVGAIQFITPGAKEGVQLQRTQLLNQIGILNVQEQQYEATQKETQAKIAMLGIEKQVTDEIDKRNLKNSKKKDTLADFTSNFIAEKSKDAAAKANVDISLIKNNDTLIKQYTQLAKVEWEAAQKKPKTDNQPKKDLETEIDLRNKSLGLLATFNNELDAIERRRKATGDEDQYQKSLNDLIKKQPAYIAQQQEINKAHEIEMKLLGKSVNLGADYYKTLEDIDRLGKSGVYSPDQVLELKDALEATTPAAKKLQAEMEKAKADAAKFSDEISSWAAHLKQLANENEMFRIEISDTSDDSKKLAISDLQKENDLIKIQADLRRKISDAEERKRKNPESSASADKAIERYKELAAAEAKLVSDNANLKLIADYAKEIDSAAGNAAGSLAQLGSTSFGNAINGLNGMVLGLDKLISRQDAFDKMRQDAAGDELQLAKINKMQAQSQLNSYANITGSMKGFFKEGTKGYKTLQTAEKVFRAFEMAMALKSAVTRITAEGSVTAAKVAGTTASSAAVASGSILEIAWTKAVNIVKGIGAILTQGSGDPYTAIPRMAAMAAIVAGLGIAVGGIGGGGGSAQKTNNGTGTVFGDSEAKSESIANSLELLEDVNSLTAQYSQQMAASLRNIETALTGVTNVILRSAGIETSARGVQAGVVPSSVGSTLMKLMDGPGLDPLLGKVINALFGTKTTITGQGVMANDATIQDIQAGQLSAGYYTDINKKKKFLGITTSDKNSTQFDESNELSRQFAGIINGFVDVVKAAAPILGVSLSDIDKSLEGFIVKIGKIDLKDLKGDEIKEKLMAVFGAAGDDIAMQTLKGFEKYQEVGEGYLETIARVATTVEQARGQMDSLNSTMLLTVDGAMELVDAFGGLEKFMQTTSSYMNAYFTDEERKATIARQGSAALKSKGFDISPDQLSKLNYLDVRGWVTSLEKGDKELYAWAQNLAVQLSPLYELPSEASASKDTSRDDNSAEDAAKKALDLQRQKLELDKQYATLTNDENGLRKATLALRALDLNAMDESLRAIQLSIWAYEDQKAALDKLVASNKALNESMARDVANAQKASDKAMAALERAVAAERKKAEAAEKAAEEIRDNLESVFELLKDSVRELFLEVDSTKKMLASQGRDLIRGAIASGILPDEKTLSDAIGSVRDNLESTQYATKYDSDRARLGFAIELDQLKGTAGEQLTEAEKQLKAAKDQLEYLDKVLETAKEELNKLRDIDSGIVSVAKAITDLTTALTTEFSTNLKQQQQYLTGTGGALYDKSTGVGTNSSGQSFTKEGLKASFDAHIAAGGSLQQAVSVLAGSGYTLNQIEDMYGSTRGSLGAILDAAGVARFAEGGAYAGGLAMVGEEGPELINFNKGGQVYTAAETQRMMSGSTNEAELRMLREEVSMLRAEARATAMSTAKLNRNIERLIVPTAEGEALQTHNV